MTIVAMAVMMTVNYPHDVHNHDARCWNRPLPHACSIVMNVIVSCLVMTVTVSCLRVLGARALRLVQDGWCGRERCSLELGPETEVRLVFDTFIEATNSPK